VKYSPLSWAATEVLAGHDETKGAVRPQMSARDDGRSCSLSLNPGRDLTWLWTSKSVWLQWRIFYKRKADELFPEQQEEDLSHVESLYDLVMKTTVTVKCAITATIFARF
jgi:hypothetical protein